VKISGACTLSHEPFPYKDIWDPLGRVFDAFGFDRCMWGTDWTRAVGMLTYEQGVEAFRDAKAAIPVRRQSMAERKGSAAVTS
jgi:L-fuconolactonase